MPLTRSEKETAVGALTAWLKRSDTVVVTDYRGLSVAQLSKLRKELRAVGAEFHVVKNTLARRALAEAGLDMPDELLLGPTAMVFLGEELAGPTKALNAFAKESNILAIRGALMGGAPLDAKATAALADLPSKDQLRGQLLGLLMQPQRQRVTLLNAPLRDMVGVLNARVEAAQEAA